MSYGILNTKSIQKLLKHLGTPSGETTNLYDFTHATIYQESFMPNSDQSYLMILLKLLSFCLSLLFSVCRHAFESAWFFLRQKRRCLVKFSGVFFLEISR